MTDTGSFDPVAFICCQTALGYPPLVPECMLYLADEITPIWEATEAELAQRGLAPPFWAFCWAGGQALARYVLDNPTLVRGRVVLDFAAGGGIAGLAAAKAGAARVVANDVDLLALEAVRLNAVANGVSLEVTGDDLLDRPPGPWDVVLAGDICYEQPLAGRVEGWLRQAAQGGATVLLGDPGRAYQPDGGMEALAAYDVPTSLELEDREIRHTRVWKVNPR